MPESEFAEFFHDEHRQMRDALLGVIGAFHNGDHDEVQDSIDEFGAIAGPHFQYESEALFPALVKLFGDEYVDELMAEHNETLATARELATLAATEDFSASEAERAAEMARAILPHVGERDGLAVMVEVMAPAEVGRILKARERARKSKGVTAKAAKKGLKVKRTAFKRRVAKPERKKVASHKKRAR